MGIRLLGLYISSVITFGAFAQNPAFEQRLNEGQQERIQGHYNEAKRIFTALLRDAQRQDPAGAFVASVYDNLGMTEQDLANYEQAERLMTNALSQLRRAGESGRASMALVQCHLGETYLEEGRYREAEQVLRKALEMWQNDDTTDPESIAITLLDLAV